MYSLWIILIGVGFGIGAALLILADAVLGQLISGASLFVIGWVLWRVSRPLPGVTQVIRNVSVEEDASVRQYSADLAAAKEILQPEPRRSKRFQ
jgi:hypothetical protein